MSVLVPVFNMADFVVEALESVFESGVSDLEVVVVDDGSTDASRRRVRAFTDPESADHDPRVTLLCQENRGKAAAMNRALERAGGQYVTILDADDRMPASGLAALVEAAARGSGSHDMIIGGFQVFDGRGVVGNRPAPVDPDPVALQRHFYRHFRTPFHLNACLLHGRLVQRVGSFDVSLKRCQDIDYSIRCLEASNSVALVARPVYWYRKYRDSASERLWLRARTAFYRTVVHAKNFSGVEAVTAISMGLLVDVGKLVFELFGHYES